MWPARNPPTVAVFEANNRALQVTAGTDLSWVTVPQPTLNTNTVTFTAWIYPDGDQADWTGILVNRSGVGSGIGFGGGANHGMLTHTWNNNTAATYNFVSGLTPPLNEWSFVAVTIEPTRAILYLGSGGVLTSATNAIAQLSQAWGGNAQIGNDVCCGSGRIFNGMLDEVAIFKYAMTPAQVSNLFKGIEFPIAPTLPTLSMTRTATGLTLTFTGTLQSADAITGPWTDLTGPSPQTVNTATGTKFFRAKQ